MYQLRPTSTDLDWLRENIDPTMTMFRDVICRRDVNYIHVIGSHALYFMENGGLARFCNDIQEMIQYFLKTSYLQFSAKGGGLHEVASLRVVWERLYFRTHAPMFAKVGSHKLYGVAADHYCGRQMDQEFT
jgi:hypothetical protein